MSPEIKQPELQVIDRDAFIAEHGLEDIADLQVEAHGAIYSMRDAIVECPPFARMITAFAASLEPLPLSKEEKTKAIENSIRSAAVSTDGITTVEPKKKLS